MPRQKLTEFLDNYFRKHGTFDGLINGQLTWVGASGYTSVGTLLFVEEVDVSFFPYNYRIGLRYEFALSHTLHVYPNTLLVAFVPFPIHAPFAGLCLAWATTVRGA